MKYKNLNILVDTCNIALILFLKCDVTKFRIPPSLVTQFHTSSTPSTPFNGWRNLWIAPNNNTKTQESIESQGLLTESRTHIRLSQDIGEQ